MGPLAATAATAAALMAIAATTAGAAERHAAPTRLTVALEAGARPGGASAVDVRLRISPRHPPATRVTLRFPAGLGIVSSGLGTAPCRPRHTLFADVIVLPEIMRAGCPRNSVMARGTAAAVVTVGDFSTEEHGSVELHAGAFSAGALRVITVVYGENPVAAMLAYDGAIQDAPNPYGGNLTATIRQIPTMPDTMIALRSLRLVLGDRGIRYARRAPNGTLVLYRPEPIGLPSRCARPLPWQVVVDHADGTTTRADAWMACPRGRGRPADASRRGSPPT